MPAIVKKILVLSLALILSLTLIGCAGGGPDQEEIDQLSQEEIDQIVANATTAIDEIDTCKADADMSMTMEIVGGGESAEMTVVGDATSAVDKVADEGQLVMSMTMDMSDISPELGEQEITMAFYVVGGWLYEGVETGGEEEWTKTGLAETFEEWWLETAAGQQIKLLTTAIEINYSGSETVYGTDCYVLEITPSIEAAADLVFQTSEFLGLGASNMADLLKEISAKQWIAKDSQLLMKAEVGALLEMHPEDIGASEGDFEKMTLDINMGIRLYDYNQPVSIELPPEALTAPETP